MEQKKRYPSLVGIPFARVEVTEVLCAGLFDFLGRHVVGTAGKSCSVHDRVTPPAKGDEIVRRVVAGLRSRTVVMDLQASVVVAQSASPMVALVNLLANSIA